MPTFHVAITRLVSTVVKVEAANADEAADTFFHSPDMPGTITHQAFGTGASVSEAGEWEAVEVIDEDGNTVWELEEDYDLTKETE